MSTSQRKEFRKILETKFSEEAEKFEKQIYKYCTLKDGDYSEMGYQLLGLLMESSKKERKPLLEEIRKGVDCWDFLVFSSYHNTLELKRGEVLTEVKLEKSEMKCRKKDCKSFETYIYQNQERSADEGATTYVVCVKCNSRYKFN